MKQVLEDPSRKTFKLDIMLVIIKVSQVDLIVTITLMFFQCCCLDSWQTQQPASNFWYLKVKVSCFTLQTYNINRQFCFCWRQTHFPPVCLTLNKVNKPQFKHEGKDYGFNWVWHVDPKTLWLNWIKVGLTGVNLG